MVLTAENDFDYFNSEMKIQIVFKEGENTFDEIEEIFRFFNELDKLYYQYTTEKFYRRGPRYYKRTQIIEISKRSPLEILVFAERHWFEILLFLLSTNRETILLNVGKYYQDLNKLTDSIEGIFREITEDFPNFEMEEIIRFINWFEFLTVEQKYSIIQIIKRSQRVINSIRKIFKK